MYGEAQLERRGRRRLDARGSGAGEPSQLPAPRLVKECVHELGHTFGLVHCDAPAVRDGAVDQRRRASTPRRRRFCHDCRVRYRESLAFAGDRIMNRERTRILVVDDEEIVRESLSGWLAKDGYTRRDGARTARPPSSG